MCIRCSVCEQKDEQKEQSEQIRRLESYNTLNMKGNIQHPSNSNVRRFQSNQSISDINNIHTDLVIMFFDRRNQNIGKKQKECKFVLGVQFVSRKTSRKSRVSRWSTSIFIFICTCYLNLYSLTIPS